MLHAPLKLAACYEHDGLCIFQRVRPAACRCEHSPFVARAQNDPYVVRDSRVVFCGLLSANYGADDVDARERWAISGRLPEADPAEGAERRRREPPFGLPLVRDQILKVITSRTAKNKILLVVADYSERMLVMELVCSARGAGIFASFMIAALDDDLYRFCIARGLPVYLSEFDESEFRDHANFRELARFQVVYELLSKGKEVCSVEPAVVFLSSPWQYFEENVDNSKDVAVLPHLPETSEMGKEKSYISSALIYARPSSKSLDLAKNVMLSLEKHDGKPGILLRAIACGRDMVFADLNTCLDGPVLLPISRELFRTMEPGDCPDCQGTTSPIAYYSSSFGLRNNVGEAHSLLKRLGLSRIDDHANFCRYWS